MRRDSVGLSSGETYVATLRELAPDALCEIIRPAEQEIAQLEPCVIELYDAVFLAGSPLHLYEETLEVHRQLSFMRAVFASGTPAFGSCAGLQVAAVAAGGRVRPNPNGYEAGFARRITPTEKGRFHPLLRGRPSAFDAPSVHADEVVMLPEGATLLATNTVTVVQAAEIRHGPGIFWGVQYHPELSLAEVGSALCRQADGLVKQGLARDHATVRQQAALLKELDQDPRRRDLAWQLGLDRETTETLRRRRELRNFLTHLMEPTRAARGRS